MESTLMIAYFRYSWFALIFSAAISAVPAQAAKKEFTSAEAIKQRNRSYLEIADENWISIPELRGVKIYLLPYFRYSGCSGLITEAEKKKIADAVHFLILSDLARTEKVFVFRACENWVPVTFLRKNGMQTPCEYLISEKTMDCPMEFELK